MKLSNIHAKLNKTDNKTQVKNTNEKPVAKSQADKAGSTGDRVELSSSSKDVGKIQAILDSTPAVRTEKVQAIRERIEQGEYQVDPKEVADKMIVSLLSDMPGE